MASPWNTHIQRQGQNLAITFLDGAGRTEGPFVVPMTAALSMAGEIQGLYASPASASSASTVAVAGPSGDRPKSSGSTKGGGSRR